MESSTKSLEGEDVSTAPDLSCKVAEEIACAWRYLGVSLQESDISAFGYSAPVILTGSFFSSCTATFNCRFGQDGNGEGAAYQLLIIAPIPWRIRVRREGVSGGFARNVC